MRHTDFRYFQEDFKRDDLLDRFSTWSEDLVDLLEKRVFGGQFKEVMNFALSFDEQMVSRLTDEEMEEQLTICSQYKFTFRQMQDELDLYLSKVERRYRSWTAALYIKAQTKVIDAKSQMYKAEKITKANITVTKDEALNQFLVDNEMNNSLWHDFIDHVKRAKNLMKNIADDMESRSMMLMSLRKRHNI